MTETGFQLVTDDQNETDRYWKAIVGNGSQHSACGCCKDKSLLQRQKFPSPRAPSYRDAAPSGANRRSVPC